MRFWFGCPEKPPSHSANKAMAVESGCGREGSRAASLTRALEQTFVVNAAQIVADTTQENADELFLAVVREEETRHEELTHFIPCAVAVQRKPESFRIGPADFILRESFTRDNEAALRESRGSRVTADWKLQQLV